MEVCTIEPDFRVLEGLEYFGPFEFFAVGGVAVSLETCSHEGLFVWCKECALRGPVHDEPVSCNADEYSSYAFL